MFPRTGFPTMLRRQGCDDVPATGLRRGCDGVAPTHLDVPPTMLRRRSLITPPTPLERTTDPLGTHPQSQPGASSRHVHPPAVAGCVQLPGSPAMFPRRCWLFPTMVPAMVSAIGNVPERPPVPAARLSGCHSLPGHQARPDSPRSSQVRRWLPQARQDTQTELGQDFRHSCLESERCKPSLDRGYLELPGPVSQKNKIPAS